MINFFSYQKELRETIKEHNECCTKLDTEIKKINGCFAEQLFKNINTKKAKNEHV